MPRRILADRAADDLTIGDLTKLAIGSGKIDGEMLDAYKEKSVTDLFRKILNRANISLEDGRTVRAFQSYTKFEQSKDGKEVQLKIWKDIDSMTYPQMLIAAKERVKHINDSRESLKNDIDYWNENVRPKFNARRIDLEF